MGGGSAWMSQASAKTPFSACNYCASNCYAKDFRFICVVCIVLLFIRSGLGVCPEEVGVEGYSREDFHQF